MCSWFIVMVVGKLLFKKMACGIGCRRHRGGDKEGSVMMRLLEAMPVKFLNNW
jgi:hypothetical protein